jgi:hypothetical protein
MLRAFGRVPSLSFHDEDGKDDGMALSILTVPSLRGGLYLLAFVPSFGVFLFICHHAFLGRVIFIRHRAFLRWSLFIPLVPSFNGSIYSPSCLPQAVPIHPPRAFLGYFYYPPLFVPSLHSFYLFRIVLSLCIPRLSQDVVGALIERHWTLWRWR